MPSLYLKLHDVLSRIAHTLRSAHHVQRVVRLGIDATGQNQSFSHPS
jgi:hypothetical protein